MDGWPSFSKRRIHLVHHIRRNQAVPAVQDLDILPRRHPDALVHGIVDALVGFGNPLQAVAEGRCQAFDDSHAFIRAGAVHDDVFIIRPGLREDALHRLLQTGRVVAVDGDDGHCILLSGFSATIDGLDHMPADIQTEMRGVREIVVIRIPFTLPGKVEHTVLPEDALQAGQVGRRDGPGWKGRSQALRRPDKWSPFLRFLTDYSAAFPFLVSPLTPSRILGGRYFP